MASLKQINRRIKSVRNTQQITRAMKMVAAAGLRRAQRDLIQARPYTDKLVEILKRVNDVTNILEHDLLAPRTGGKELYIVFASDRGLCGSFNAYVNRFAEDLIRQHEDGAIVFTVGNKAGEYFRYRQIDIEREYTDMGDHVKLSQAEEIAEAVLERYLSGEVSKVHLIYVRFKSAMSRTQECFQLLPIIPPEADGGLKTEYILDPSPERVLDELLPRYVMMTMFRAMLESKASEQGARMAAMDAATNNAEEMIRKLTIIRNRARQAAITTEISEIVGGADALK